MEKPSRRWTSAFCPLSLSLYISISLCFFCLFPLFAPSSLSWEERIPMVASAASNALTSSSDLRATLVIRQDSFLSGSPTASVPLSSYPLLFPSRPLSSLPQQHFPFIFRSRSPPVCSVCRVLLSPYYYLWALEHQLYNFSRWYGLMKIHPDMCKSFYSADVIPHFLSLSL